MKDERDFWKFEAELVEVFYAWNARRMRDPSYDIMLEAIITTAQKLRERRNGGSV